jgi:DNA-binding beta-propeller fold protein YncE
MEQGTEQGRKFMYRQLLRTTAFAVGALPFISFGASAQLAVSANDGKAVLVNGVNSVPPNPAADYVAVIDLGTTPPKLVGEVAAPTSLVGPPQSVAVARDETFALVTAAKKINPGDPTKLVSDDKLTVIDLKSSPPKVLATLQAGKGAAGVSINGAGTLALVANRDEGTVLVFMVAGNTLTATGKIQLGDDKSGPSHAAFTPDGKMALVTRDGDHKISVLSIDGTNVEYTKRDMIGGIRPYSLEVSSKGDAAFYGNQGGGQGDSDTINAIDLKATPPRIVNTWSVGQTPEGLALSPDGSYLAVTVMNGTSRPKSSPFFNNYGLVKVFAEGDSTQPLTEAKVGNWCQGAAWSKTNATLVVQCMVENEVQVFSFDGTSLKPGNPIWAGWHSHGAVRLLTRPSFSKKRRMLR